MINEKLVDIIKKGKGYVGILAGSGSDDKPKGDKPSHVEQIVIGLEKFKIPYGVHICSAHKQAVELDAWIKEYNKLVEPILLVAVAGGTDALSGTSSWESCHPIVSCPPDAPNSSCLTNPPGSSNAYIARPANVGKFAAQMFSHLDVELIHKFHDVNNEKVFSLQKDNRIIGEKWL